MFSNLLKNRISMVPNDVFFRWLSLGEQKHIWDQPALRFPVNFLGQWAGGQVVQGTSWAQNPQLFGKQNPMGFVIPGRMEHLGYHRLKPPTSIPGWWLTYPSEKYESQLGGWSFPIYGRKKTFLTTNQLQYILLGSRKNMVSCICVPLIPIHQYITTMPPNMAQTTRCKPERFVSPTQTKCRCKGSLLCVGVLKVRAFRCF